MSSATTTARDVLRRGVRATAFRKRVNPFTKAALAIGTRLGILLAARRLMDDRYSQDSCIARRTAILAPRTGDVGRELAMELAEFLGISEADVCERLAS